MIQRMVQRLAAGIYRRLKKSRMSQLLFPKGVLQDIQKLGKQEAVYYTQKIIYAGVLLLLFLLLIVLYAVGQIRESKKTVQLITRPKVYEETQNIVIRAGEEESLYELELGATALSKEEAEEYLSEATGALKSLMLNENASADCVTGNLLLPESLPKYPFEIFWESDMEEVVDTYGVVNRTGLTEDTLVMLTAVFTYQEWMWEESFGVLVCREALTEQEAYVRSLGTFLQESEKEQRSKEVWNIPAMFAGKDLTVRLVKKENTLLILAGLLLLAGVCIWRGQDYDLHTVRKKRREAFAAEYISFVESLSMYLSAGLTLPAAMQHCAADYTRRKEQDHLLRNCLQEFQRDIQNGCSFLEAMELFAEKTDEAAYRRLAGILNQSIVNGSSGLAEQLLQEVEKLREEKRRKSKVRGEQISTALIAPMMLQLGVIIALMMIPAFSNISF